MAVVDMPLEKLWDYRGSSPCPADIDAFWDKSLEQMRAVNPDIELREADFQAPNVKCYDLFFTGTGGARVHAKLLKPAKISSPVPALVEFHGYTGHSGDWASKLAYAANGFIVASLDVRGQSGLSIDNSSVSGYTYHGQIIRGIQDGPEKLFFRNVFLDTAQLAGIVMDMEDVDASRVGSKGGSQGGALSLVCASLEPRIKCAASNFPFLCDYKRVWQLDLGTSAYAEIKDCIRRFDPRHENIDNFFNTLAYIDIQNLVHRIKAKTLVMLTLRDDICPPSTQFAAYNRIEAEKECRIYPDHGHENLPDAEDIIFSFICEYLAKK
jgi:cephalosporin-C deacetylase